MKNHREIFHFLQETRLKRLLVQDREFGRFSTLSNLKNFMNSTKNYGQHEIHIIYEIHISYEIHTFYEIHISYENIIYDSLSRSKILEVSTR